MLKAVTTQITWLELAILFSSFLFLFAVPHSPVITGVWQAAHQPTVHAGPLHQASEPDRGQDGRHL